MEETPANTRDDAEVVKLWQKRAEASKLVIEGWQKQYRVEDCYQYWRGKQREDDMDGEDRKAMHNMIHPDIAEMIPSLYFYTPYGKVIAEPSSQKTPSETVHQKARLLEDMGLYLVQDPEAGFKDNTFLALKESAWAFGAVEVGYDPDFISNPAADRPPLMEKPDTPVSQGADYTTIANFNATPQSPTPPTPVDSTAKDALGLSIDQGSDLASLQSEAKRLRDRLKGETFFVKFIPSKQVLIAPSDKALLGSNDWHGYWEDYPLEDVKRSTAYQNTADLKADTGMAANADTGAVDRVRLYRVWDTRTKTKLVFTCNSEKFLMQMPFNRPALKFLRHDVDPYHFFPIPPVYLKLASQDEYNDSAEYLRKQRLATVGRFTYDEDALTAADVAKFVSRDMNIMIPRKGGTHAVIEPVQQPSLAGTAMQTLALGEKEFDRAGKAGGNPLNPATQTATRAAIANARSNATDGFARSIVSDWLASIIQELILLAVEKMNIDKWVAVNVDLDSPDAMQAAAEVIKTYQLINAEKLRNATIGINWHIEVETDSLSPVGEAERGQKLMQVLNFISNPTAAMLLSKTPKLLERILSLSGIKAGEDVDAIMEGLQAIVAMNQLMAQNKVAPTGNSPTASGGPPSNSEAGGGGPPSPSNIPGGAPPGAPPLNGLVVGGA